MSEPRAETKKKKKKKKGVFGKRRCCAAPIFTPFCPHLHAETRRSLISWEIAGFCALGGAPQRRRRRRPGISRGTRDWKRARPNPGCIPNRRKTSAKHVKRWKTRRTNETGLLLTSRSGPERPRLVTSRIRGHPAGVAQQQSRVT